MVTSEIAWHWVLWQGVSDRRRSATSASRKSRALREGSASALASRGAHRHVFGMFVITEADAAAIRAVFNQEGELSAAIEVRRLFPGITDNVRARECARTIAGWKPLPAAACQITPLRLRRSRARPTKP
jgi:hypothetical protein